MRQKTIKAKYVSGASQFIDIDGLDVHYRDEGDGPILLCLHGIQSSLHTWDGWVRELKSKYRILRIDLPGWGFTGASNFGYDRDNMIRFLKKFVDAMGIRKLSIAGNSYGGYLAWNFVADYQSMVEKMILLDAGGYPCRTPAAVIFLTMPIFRYLTTIATPKFIVANFIRDVYGDQSLVTNSTIERYYDIMTYHNNRKETVKTLPTIRKQMESKSDRIATIKIPTCIMWGKKDEWIPIVLQEYFKNDIPHAHTIVYEQAGHIPMEEIPEITARDADTFLSGRYDS